MLRPLVIAVGLFGIAIPALAQSPTSVTSGAMAGRSPHQLFIAADADRDTCGKTMHSLPAGKPHSYGRQALGTQACSQPLLADRAAPQTAAASD